MIIFATGFLLKENYSIFMDYNKEIREFADSPDYGTYYGTFHGLAPNFCTFLGPMTGLGHNSIIFMIGMSRDRHVYKSILMKLEFFPIFISGP